MPHTSHGKESFPLKRQSSVFLLKAEVIPPLITQQDLKISRLEHQHRVLYPVIVVLFCLFSGEANTLECPEG